MQNFHTQFFNFWHDWFHHVALVHVQQRMGTTFAGHIQFKHLCDPCHHQVLIHPCIFWYIKLPPLGRMEICVRSILPAAPWRSRREEGFYYLLTLSQQVLLAWCCLLTCPQTFKLCVTWSKNGVGVWSMLRTKSGCQFCLVSCKQGCKMNCDANSWVFAGCICDSFVTRQ